MASRISDALVQGADVAAFSDALAEVLTFLHAHRIDAVLVEPPYTEALASDEHFKKMVTPVNDQACAQQVVLIRRSTAMHSLPEQQKPDGAASGFNQNTIALLSTWRTGYG